MTRFASRPAALFLVVVLAGAVSCAGAGGPSDGSQPGDIASSAAATAASSSPSSAPVTTSSTAGSDPTAAPAPAPAPAPAAAPAPAPAAAPAPQPAPVAAPAPAPQPSPAPAPSQAPFRFLAWGDTKVDTGTSAGDVLQALSADAKNLNPAPRFTIYLGDLEENGFNDTAGLADQWLAHLNGGTGNGTSAMTFVTRGNHDAIDGVSTSNWQGYFDFAGVARTVGATTFAELDAQLTYSFDYGNSHFVVVDAPGDFPQLVTSRQLAWLEQDLTSAEARGLTHAFLLWHGPLYTVSTSIHALDNLNPAPAIQQLIAIAGRHPIVSALINGHEHLLAYKHIDAAAFPTLTVAHEFEQFTIGTGGAAFHDPAAGRGDAVLPYVPAYATVDVNGRAVTVTWRALGDSTPQGTFTFSK